MFGSQLIQDSKQDIDGASDDPRGELPGEVVKKGERGQSCGPEGFAEGAGEEPIEAPLQVGHPIREEVERDHDLAEREIIDKKALEIRRECNVDQGNVHQHLHKIDERPKLAHSHRPTN